MKGILKSLFKNSVKNTVQAELETPSKNAVPAFPAYICMETTNACNLRCIHCLYKGGTTEHYHGKVGFIDLNLSKRILDQLKTYNAAVMLNGDGEALLHPQFHEIARYALEIGLENVYFNTNGTRLIPEFTDEFIKYFKGSVSFSLDGFKESHERIRAGSSYDLVVNNIKYLQLKIRETGADIKIGVAYCNYDQPSEERDSFVKYWVDKVDVVSIGEVYDKDYRIISSQLNRQEKPQRLMCGVPWSTFIVRWDGKVIPCSNCFSLEESDDIVLGDASSRGLYEIWHGAKMEELRMMTESWQLDGTPCESCERWNMYVQFEPVEDENIKVLRSGVFTTYMRKAAE